MGKERNCMLEFIRNHMVPIIILLLGVAFLIFAWWENNALTVMRIDFTSAKVPDGFDGYKIVQISDLHNKRFGKNQQRLMAKITAERPDLIAVTGDLVDSRHTDIAVAMEFIRAAVAIAPVYYVPGNHEADVEEYGELLIQLADAGVTVLSDAAVALERGGDTVTLLGLADPKFLTGVPAAERPERMEETLSGLLTEGEALNILLSHRPELFDLYARAGADLVFCGHAHGGQIRLPLIGGLFAPNQGLFPEYTAGAYESGETTMVVSRGLGGSVFPLRVFNRPEVVTVTFGKKSQSFE